MCVELHIRLVLQMLGEVFRQQIASTEAKRPKLKLSTLVVIAAAVWFAIRTWKKHEKRQRKQQQLAAQQVSACLVCHLYAAECS